LRIGRQPCAAIETQIASLSASPPAAVNSLLGEEILGQPAQPELFFGTERDEEGQRRNHGLPQRIGHVRRLLPLPQPAEQLADHGAFACGSAAVVR
jgi:hypothetical protein